MPTNEDGTAQDKKLAVRRRRQHILAGAVTAVCLVLLGAWLFKTYGPKKQAPPLSMNTIGVINLQKAAEAHGAFAQLKELRGERESLAADLQMDSEVGTFQPLAAELQSPEAGEQPFDDGARQKQHLAMIRKYGELSQKLKAAEKARRADTREAYETERDAVDHGYLNEILNIRIKLDSAKAMRLSQSDVEALAQQLDDLQLERGDCQQALAAAYEDGIHAYLQQLVNQNRAEMQQYAATAGSQLDAAALQQQTEAQARNSAAMEGQVQDFGDRAQRLLLKKTALAAKDEEIRVLEEHIYQDISGKAAKLAILHHLTLILADPGANLRGLEYELFHSGPWTESHTLLINVDTIDLTDEIIAELQAG